MYSILLDTHSKDLFIIIYKDHKVISENKYTFPNQSKYIISKLQEVLDSNKIDIKELKEIIVVNGPGSFTGVRIGVTVAKTIAYALDIPIKSISSLYLQAINANSDKDYLIAIPDNKGYYVGEFSKDNKLLKDYYYIPKSEFNDKDVLNVTDINWNLIYENNCLTDEDYYNMKPLYIKKIEVEK